MVLKRIHWHRGNVGIGFNVPIGSAIQATHFETRDGIVVIEFDFFEGRVEVDFAAPLGDVIHQGLTQPLSGGAIQKGPSWSRSFPVKSGSGP